MPRHQFQQVLGLEHDLVGDKCTLLQCKWRKEREYESLQILQRRLKSPLKRPRIGAKLLNLFGRETLVEQAVARIRTAKKGWAPPKGPFAKKAWERLARRFEEFNSGA